MKQSMEDFISLEREYMEEWPNDDLTTQRCRFLRQCFTDDEKIACWIIF